MGSKVPNAWDEEDWEKSAEKPSFPTLARRPNPAAAPFNPPTAPRVLRAAAPEFDHPLLYTPTSNGQPKTLYKPELKILKRNSPEVPGTTRTITPPTDEPEKDRRERERKEKERRYKEARDRIMGDATTTSSASTTQVAPAEGVKSGKKSKPQSGKRSPESTPSRATSSASNRHRPTSSLSSPRGPSPAPSSRTPSRAPSRKPSPPRSAVTSFSLNGGGFAAAPVPVSVNRFYAQKELDGKLLESQLINSEDAEDGGVYLGEGTEPEGLDWDSFSRDKGWGPQQQQSQWGPQGYNLAGEYGYTAGGGGGGYAGYDYTISTAPNYDYLSLQPRQQNPAIYGGSITTVDTQQGRFNGYTEKQGRAPGSSQAGVVQAVRAPRGPDSDGGRGFKGRGGLRNINGTAERMKGMRFQQGGVREFVPGGSSWGG